MEATHEVLDRISRELDELVDVAWKLYLTELNTLKESGIEDFLLDNCFSKLKNAYDETVQFINMSQNLIESIRIQINVAISLRGEGKLNALYLTQLNREINKLEANKLLIPGVLSSMRDAKQFYQFNGIDTNVRLCVAKLNAELENLKDIRPIKEELPDTKAGILQPYHIQQLNPKELTQLKRISGKQATTSTHAAAEMLTLLPTNPDTMEYTTSLPKRKADEAAVPSGSGAKIIKQEPNLIVNMSTTTVPPAPELPSVFNAEITQEPVAIEQEMLNVLRNEIGGAISRAFETHEQKNEEDVFRRINTKIDELIKFYIEAISKSQSDITATVLGFVKKMADVQPNIIDVQELHTTMDTLSSTINRINATNQSVKYSIDTLNKAIESGADRYGEMEAALRSAYNQQSDYIIRTTKTAEDILNKILESNNSPRLKEIEKELLTLNANVVQADYNFKRMYYYMNLVNSFMRNYSGKLKFFGESVAVDVEKAVSDWRHDQVIATGAYKTMGDLENFVVSWLQSKNVRLTET
jgi:hypothetical protein